MQDSSELTLTPGQIYHLQEWLFGQCGDCQEVDIDRGAIQKAYVPSEKITSFADDLHGENRILFSLEVEKLLEQLYEHIDQHTSFQIAERDYQKMVDKIVESNKDYLQLSDERVLPAFRHIADEAFDEARTYFPDLDEEKQSIQYEHHANVKLNRQGMFANDRQKMVRRITSEFIRSLPEIDSPSVDNVLQVLSEDVESYVHQLLKWRAADMEFKKYFEEAMDEIISCIQDILEEEYYLTDEQTEGQIKRLDAIAQREINTAMKTKRA